MYKETVKHLITETCWFWTTPDEVKERRRQITTDLRSLYQNGLVPQSPCSVLDAGSGSGGGTMAIKELFPKANVWMIDDDGSHQNHLVYKRRPLPAFAAKFQRMSVEIFAGYNSARFDFILACRLPVCYDQSPTWRETCTRGANRLIALARMLSPNGVLAFGYSLKEYPRGTTVLLDNFSLKKLFTRKTHLSFNDDWLILGGANQEFLMRVKENPQLLLTETGQKPDYPYYFRGGLAQDVWDY